MTKATAKTGKANKAKRRVSAVKRVWLIFPPDLTKRPILWELARKFKVVTNIRQASVTNEIGFICLELEGSSSVIEQSLAWLDEAGVQVERVDLFRA